MIPTARFDSLEEALSGIDIPEAIRSALALVDIPYCSFDGQARLGQMVIHADIAQEVRRIFENILEDRFPIHSVIPVAAYGWDDGASMEANNTSAFNYRHIAGTANLSNHSFGRAIDINPLQNPYYARDGRTYPSLAAYDPNVPGTLALGSSVVAHFKRCGWTWLGERQEYTDYQHFEKLS